jgi:mitogen-activated protein kinase 1/3
VITILYNLVLGVKFLHDVNVIHRDIKPANILIDSQCSIKFCDFGLARSIEEPSDIIRTMAHDIRSTNLKKRSFSPFVMTRFYRAPEVIVVEEYGTPIDLWSVGCILAELIRFTN